MHQCWGWVGAFQLDLIWPLLILDHHQIKLVVGLFIYFIRIQFYIKLNLHLSLPQDHTIQEHPPGISPEIAKPDLVVVKPGLQAN